MALPDPLINMKDIAPGAVTFQKGSLGNAPTGKAAERRVYVTFPAANAARPVFHGLGRRPTQVIGLPHGGGVVYTDYPMICDTRTVMVKCSVAGVTAELIVR